MSYRVTIDGHSWLTDDLTLDEACAIEEETGTTWHVMEPINSAKIAKSILSHFLAREMGLMMARGRVGIMTITETLACITEDKAKSTEPAPKAEEPTSDSPEPSES